MHGDVDIVAERFTQICVAFCRLAEFRAVQCRGERPARSSTPAALAPSTPGRTESEFERRESFRRRFHLIGPSLALRFIEHIRWTTVRVNRNVLPDRSAEQAIDGVPGDFSGKIPECDVD